MTSTVDHPFVGREAELADLVRHLDPTPGGPSAVIVEGPSASGKSALVAAALRVRAESGRPALTVRKAVGRVGPHGLLSTVLGQWGVKAQEISSLGPHPDEDVLADVLHRTWGPTPLVVVEEAHQVDPTVLALVHAAVLRLPERPPLLVVARPEPRVDLPDSHRIVLGGIGVEAAAQLVAAARPTATPGAVRTARVLVAGLPGDLLDLIRESPTESWREDRPDFLATRRHRERVHAARNHLPSDSWDLLAAAAVLGEGADLADALALAGVDAAAADGCVEAGLLLVGGTRGRRSMRFDHPMTPLAVRHATGPGAVLELHRRAADQVTDEGDRLRHLVEAGTGPDPTLLAHLEHYARRQAAMGRWAEAARAYVDAARLASSPLDRAHLLTDAVDARVGAGDIPQALELVDELRNDPPGPRIDGTLGYLAILRGRSREAEAWLTRAWTHVAESHEPGGVGGLRPGADVGEVRAMLCARWVLHSLVSGDGRAVVEWADRAAAHGGPVSVHGLEAASIRGLGLGASGRWEDARRAFDDAFSLAQAPAQAQRVTMGRGWLDLAMDDPQAARAAFESAVSADYSHGSARIALWAQAWLARTLFVLGDWDDCLDVTRRAAAQLDATGHDVIRPLVHWPAAVVCAYRQDAAGAAAHLRLGDASAHDYVAMFLPSAIARAQVAEAAADYDGVLRALRPVAERFDSPEDDPGFWPWRDIYAGALVVTGRLDEAQRVVDLALAHARRQGRRSAVARAEMVDGRLRGARGDLHGALDAFERARAQLTELPMPLESARLTFVQGQVLRRAGRRREADEVIRAAREAFARLGADAYTSRCDRELKASGRDRTGRDDPSGLTPQEAAVVELVAAGRTNKETAEELFLSVKTVQYHLTRVYSKLGLRSRSELAAYVSQPSEGLP